MRRTRKTRSVTACAVVVGAGLLAPGAASAASVWTFTTIASFNGTNGASPRGTLLLDAGGNLYGTTAGGGANSFGAVFEVAHGATTITPLASFAGATNGANPQAGLVMDAGGNLYGTTANGGSGGGNGVVFELAQGAATITALAPFNGSTNGARPNGRLVLDAGGNLYGTTTSGGAGTEGTVFKLAHGASSVTTLAAFPNSFGGYTWFPTDLIRDAGGNLYGTTVSGGANRIGTVFELAQGTSSITTLASFDAAHGFNPYGSVVMDASGDLFGVTVNGGASGYGTVFEVVHNSAAVTTLASFDGANNGANPYGDLVRDAAGNLYGTASAGGANGKGTVFELALGASSIIPLASFNGATNGANPQAGLVMDAAGNLYGVAANGGAGSHGTVFELSPPTIVPTPLALWVGLPAVACLILHRFWRRPSAGRA